MVSMARTPQEKEEAVNLSLPTLASAPDYPYGLSISLGDAELAKLGFEIGDLAIDDMVHLHCMAVVTSTSHNAVSGGPDCCRVELQITHISAEDENEENEENDTVEDKPMGVARKNISSRLYK